MLKIDILSIHSGLLDGPFSHSIIKRAIDQKLVQINIIDLRIFTTDKHKTVDDYPFGGGAGMVMKIEPIQRAIDHLNKSTIYDEIIYMSPDGDLLDQPIANRYSMSKNLLILCGHYKGIDERIREHLITKEISIGNYVLSGGELPAAVFCDAIIRLIPGAIGDETSALSDSFQDQLVAPPIYTRPADYMGWKVPDILLSGNEQKISEWRLEQSIKRTKAKRPGLFNE